MALTQPSLAAVIWRGKQQMEDTSLCNFAFQIKTEKIILKKKVTKRREMLSPQSSKQMVSSETRMALGTVPSWNKHQDLTPAQAVQPLHVSYPGGRYNLGRGCVAQ